MSQLYSPPTWRNVQTLVGSLRYGIPTNYCVYRKGGSWYSSVSPGIGELDGADYVFTTPTVVPDSLVAELTAFGQGTLTPL